MLGGLIYQLVGYYATSGVVLVVITLDLPQLCLVVGKRTAQRWLECPPERDGSGTMDNNRQDNDPVS